MLLWLRGMLLWLRGLFGRSGAATSQPGHSESYVTKEQLELELGEFTKRQEWFFDEWYDKFNTLHARFSRRVKRAEELGVDQVAPAPEQGVPSEVEIWRRARANGIVR